MPRTDAEFEQLRARYAARDPAGAHLVTEMPGELLVKVTLVPVEVFGTECDACETEVGYGLADAIGAGSDCNRARGHIYRRADAGEEHNSADVVTVWVPRSELPKFEQRREL